MTTNSRTSRRLAAGSLAAAAVAVLAAANPAAGTSHSAYDAACSFDPASLPRTADAVDGWYDQCLVEQHYATTSDFPSTPDAVEGWFTQRKTGQRFAANPGPRALEATDTPTADRQVNWRRQMDEVPESPQLLGRPAPLTDAGQNGFRGMVESGAGHPAWTGDRSPSTDTEQDQQRVRAAFERGVGPGRSLYSPRDQM
jgi:hypothetical protein